MTKKTQNPDKTNPNPQGESTKNTLEQNIRELEIISKKIEGEISINEIVSTYKTASEIIQKCKAEIQSIENEIIEINAQANLK